MTFKQRLGIAITIITVMLTCGLVSVELSDAPTWIDTLSFLAIGIIGFGIGIEIIREPQGD